MSIFLMSTWHLSLFSFSCILTFGYLPFFKCHTRKCLLANDILANVMDSALHMHVAITPDVVLKTLEKLQLFFLRDIFS